jgi:hypothetical protein
MPGAEVASILFATLAGVSLVVALLLAFIAVLGRLKGRSR